MSVQRPLCSQNTTAPRSPLAIRPLALAVHMLAAGIALASPTLHAADQAEQTDNSGAVDLAPIDISGTATRERSAVTEDTNSYTTEAARTATPLSMSIRETPQSVSVVTQQRMQDQNLDTIVDVVNNATGVSINRYETNRGQINARGFELNSLMIDGVPTIYEQPWSGGEIFGSLAMYDRVEIVRGANGLMTGAGDPSASINMVRKRASSTDMKGSVEVSGGTWDTYGLKADVAGALNSEGTIRGRFVTETEDGDSWIDMNSTSSQTFYGTMDIDLTPDTTLWFGLSRQKTKTDSPMWGGLPIWYADGSRTNWSRSKTTSADWSKWDTTYETYFVNLDHRFANDWQMNLSASRGERNSDSALLYLSGNPGKDGSAPMFAFPAIYKTKTTQNDYSIRFSGPFSMLGREHDLAFGYTDSKQEFRADTRTAPLNSSNSYDPVLNFDSYNGNYPEPQWNQTSYYGSSETRQKGAFAATRLNVTDDLKVILGARESWYEKNGFEAGNASAMDVDHELTPYVGAVYDLTDNLSAYASYTEIFLPQSVTDANGQQLDPITGESNEMGLKGEFLDGRLNASAAIFLIKQDNLGQVTNELINPLNPSQGFAYEPADVTSKGFELEVSGELATDWNASLGYTQFKVKDSDGEKANTLYPTKLLRTFTTYRLPGALNKLTVGGGVNWQTSTYTYAQNPAGVNEKITLGSYALVNLMARYDISENLSAQLNANNVTDKKYFDIFDAYGALTYGEPRSLTASAKYRF